MDDCSGHYFAFCKISWSKYLFLRCHCKFQLRSGVFETLTCCMKHENLSVPLLGKKNRSHALFLEIVHQISVSASPSSASSLQWRRKPARISRVSRYSSQQAFLSFSFLRGFCFFQQQLSTFLPLSLSPLSFFLHLHSVFFPQETDRQTIGQGFQRLHNPS